MKAVIVLLALVALAYCQNPCVNYTTIAAPTTDGAWTDALALPDPAVTPFACYSFNGTSPDLNTNYTLVLAARFDSDSQAENATFFVVWNNANPVGVFGNVSVSAEDDVDSICALNGSYPLQAGGNVYFTLYATAANTSVNVWTQFSDDPQCGAGVDVSGGSSFWIWIIVAVVIVVIIAVIIAGAGAFVYYQKKKKGQAKLYEDS